jgi:ankyrin repeat protein
MKKYIDYIKEISSGSILRNLWFSAIIDNNIYKVKKLIEDGIEYNFRDGKNRTALMLAVLYDYKEIVELLLQQPNIDLKSKSAHNYTALDYAKQFKNKDIINLIEKKYKEI